VHFYAMHVIMHLSMFTPRGGGIPGEFDFVCLPKGGEKYEI
jgi:hypothetical protein